MGERSKNYSKKALVYEPEYALMLGSVTAALFLKQVAFWHDIKRGQPFYKFNSPCSHKSYNEGDSWEEELGFSRAELDGARAKVGTKLTKDSGIHKADILMMDKAEFNDKGVMTNADKLVVYWTDKDRVTYYLLNEALLEDALSQHKLMQESRISDKRTKCRKVALPSNAEKSLYPLTENTSENTNITTLRANDARVEPPQASLFGTAEPLPSQKMAPKKKAPPSRPFYDAIFTVFGAVEAYNGLIQKAMEGRISKRHAGHEANFTIPATPEETLAFGEWWGKKYPDATPPLALDKIQNHFEAFRREKAAAERAKQPKTRISNGRELKFDRDMGQWFDIGPAPGQQPAPFIPPANERATHGSARV